jgi:hypothetical protein
MTRLGLALRRRIPAVALLAGLFAMFAPAPAFAALPVVGDCKPAPTPEVPGRGMTGWFGRPNQTGGEGATLYERYDLAGMTWSTYDLGCGGSVRDEGATWDTFLANGLLQLPKMGVAAVAAITEASRQPTFLGVFDPLLREITTRLTNGFAHVWLPVTVALVGLIIVWGAHRGQTARNVTAVGWVLLVVAMLSAVVRWPVEAGHAADSTIVASVGAADRSIAGGSTSSGAGSAGETAYEAVLYQQWAAGVFGSATSATARKYGPALLDATALTWDEAARSEADPGTAKRIVEDKQKAFGDIADKIKDEDPDAYRHLQGKTADRLGLAALSLLAATCTLPFLLAASLLLLGAFLIIRFVVMIFPLLATVGVMQPTAGVVRSTIRVASAAAVNSVMFGVLSAVAVRILGFELLSAGLPGWLAVTLALITTICLWRLSHPFRSLTRMVSPGHGLVAGGLGIQDDLRRARRTAWRMGTTFWAARMGAKSAVAKRPPRADDDNNGDEPLRVAATRGYPERYEAAPAADPPPAIATPGADLAPAPSPRYGWQRRTAGVAADAPREPAAELPAGRPAGPAYVEDRTGSPADPPAAAPRRARLTVGPDGVPVHQLYTETGDDSAPETTVIVDRDGTTTHLYAPDAPQAEQPARWEETRPTGPTVIDQDGRPAPGPGGAR